MIFRKEILVARLYFAPAVLTSRVQVTQRPHGDEWRLLLSDVQTDAGLGALRGDAPVDGEV